MSERKLTKALVTAGVASMLLIGGVSAQAAEKVRIGLPVPNYGPYVPVHAAYELGIFKANGIDAEINVYKGGAAAQEAMAAGDVDITINSPSFAALAVQKGVKQKIVGAWVSAPNGWHVVVLKDSPVQSMKDLDGKTIGITATGGLTDLYSKYAAKENGVTVKTIPVGASGLIPALKGKQVDASTMHSPLPYRMISTGEGRSVFNIGKALTNSIPDVLIASQAFIDKKPEVVKAALLSMYQATARLQADREGSLKLMAKFTGESDPATVAEEYDVILKAMPTSARIDLAWLKSSYDLAKLGGLPTLPPVEEIYISDFSAITGAK